MDVRSFGRQVTQRLHGAPVHFHGRDLGPAIREGHRERPQPRADLEHAIARFDPGVGHDASRQVGIHEEVLAERFLRPDPVTGCEIPQRTRPEPSPGGGLTR